MSHPPATGWAVPPFPHPPVDDDPSVTEVPDAFLTAVRRGDLRTVQAPTKWLRGAVHDAEGHLVVASQKIGGLGGSPPAMADPSRVRVSAAAPRLEGTWLYGGHWIQPFGHFFTETVTTLWPEPTELPGLAGVVFHSFMSRFRGIEPWQSELVDLAGYGGLPIEVIEAQPLRVERLLVPGRSVIVNGWAHPGARAVWQRIVTAVHGSHDAGESAAREPATERVFVSRTAFNAERRSDGRPVRTSPERDAELDAVFASAGFVVVAPETLSVRDQVRLAAGCEVLAGGAGTALHLSAFAPAGTRVLEVGDTRSPDVQVPQQQVIDHLCEHPTAFVPHHVAGSELARRLTDLGL